MFEVSELDIETLKSVFPSEKLRDAYLAIYEHAIKEHKTRFHSIKLIQIIQQRLGILRESAAGNYLKLLDKQGAFWHPDSQNPTLVVVKPPHELIDEKRGGGL
ncbi:MAG: hypothetical protein J7L63_05005 [Thermoplasmata archaeon]|nr:hypothetical protein [Thermoplasmata archaeon]